MARIDITPSQVHAMGGTASDVADTWLTSARTAMTHGYEYRGTARLGGFQTDGALDSMLFAAKLGAEGDVLNIRSVGNKLHATANAIVHGDNANVDEIGRVHHTVRPHLGIERTP